MGVNGGVKWEGRRQQQRGTPTLEMEKTASPLVAAADLMFSASNSSANRGGEASGQRAV